MKKNYSINFFNAGLYSSFSVIISKWADFLFDYEMQENTEFLSDVCLFQAEKIIFKYKIFGKIPIFKLSIRGMKFIFKIHAWREARKTKRDCCYITETTDRI